MARLSSKNRLGNLENLTAYKHRSLVRTLIARDPSYLGMSSPRQHPQGQGRGCFMFLTGTMSFILTACVVLSLVTLLAGASAVSFLVSSVPPAEELANVRFDQSTKIYDRNGHLLFEIFDPQGGRRTIIPPERIPEVLKDATIATEDPTFYTNPGVDWQGVIRALYYNTQTDRSIGGSTITQQLVKLTLLGADPTIERKIREAILSLEITRRYSKDEILALYLNTINYGNLAYGIQAASRAYFKKDAIQLDLAEASLLAGLPQAPSVYDPCVNPDAALDRQQVVLRLMVKYGYFDDTTADQAGQEMKTRLHAPDFPQNCTIEVSQVAPHFVDYVRKQLEEQYGPEAVYKGGLRVYTTIDPTIQKLAEDEARAQIATLKAKNVTNASVVVANPQTGEIYAMVGSVDFFNKSIDGQVNIATALRQPGSSIKPINYVTALKRGWTLATPLLDNPAKFPNWPQPYVPINYDHKYHGIVSMRDALANSLNIPAVKTLFFVGVPQMIDTAHTFGISTFGDPSRYGLSLTLGGGEVMLVEHTGAYAAFANQGKRVPLTPFLKIVDGEGHSIYDLKDNVARGEQVIDPRYTYLITNVLSDNKARTPEFGANSPLKLCLDGAPSCPNDKVRPVAAKTGTTNDFRDNWTMGYTPELVVGVWVGNANNSQMKNSTGITGASPIWHNVMERIYKEIPPFKDIAPHDFLVPPGLVKVEVCNESGLLPTEACPTSHRHVEIFLAEQAPRTYDKYWTGEWGGRCVVLGSENRDPLQLAKAPGIPDYAKAVDYALKHGIPQSLAGLNTCEERQDQPQANNTLRPIIPISGQP